MIASELAGKSNIDKLEIIFNTSLAHQDLPFDYYDPITESDRIADERFPREEDKIKPIFIDTGKMAIAGKDRDMLSDGFFACAALIIEGSNANSFTHMVSGNDSRNFGYWGNEYCDPIQGTSEKIASTLPKLGTSERALVLVSGQADDGRKERLLELKKKLTEMGIPHIRIVEAPVDNSLVYYSPTQPDSVSIIGSQKDENGVRRAKYYTVNLDGEDTFIS